MVVIFGKRYARIGRYLDKEHICYPCKAYDREILVYRPYFHFCLIPVLPIGPKQFEIRCRNCGDETRSESIIEEYNSRAKTPFYLYSAWILLASLGIFWFYWNKNTQKHKIEYVNYPVVGDVYNIRQVKNEETSYYFLKITGIVGDTIVTVHNNLYYGDFVNHLAKDDYFMKDDTILYTRKKLKEMLDDDEIFSVERGYGKEDGFDRIR